MFCALACCTALYAQKSDWAQYSRYEAANREIAFEPVAVFMGNSITDIWYQQHPAFFDENHYLGRGIGGQVTSQMLCRFRADVINLRPKAVVILAGTNDLALNNGPIEIPHIAENIISMAELALAEGIRPILCTVLPVGQYPWRPEVTDVPGKIGTLNGMLHEYAEKRGITWVDYHSAMDAGDGSMRKELSNDGVHPTREGYDLMEKVLAPALKRYLPAKR